MADELPDQVVKHLEMTQTVISRLGTDSFLVKGWSITFMGAVLGFAISSKEPSLAWVGFVSAAAFWWLDTYYLRAERLFRMLYEKVRTRDAAIDPFVMNATATVFIDGLSPDQRKKVGWWRVARGSTVAPLHLGMTLVAIAIAIAGPKPAATSDSGKSGPDAVHQAPRR